MDLGPVRHILHAITTTMVPESSTLNDRGWGELEAIMTTALAGREPRVRQQLVVFIRLLQVIPLVRYGRPLTRLSASRRRAFLEAAERSRLLLVRRGVWGLRTLIFMGYYTRDDVAEAIGYRASPDGWMARGGTAATVPLAPTLWLEP